MPSAEKLQSFVEWCAAHITGDEKGQAQIFLDRLFQSCGHPGVLDVGGTAFANLVWIRSDFRKTVRSSTRQHRLNQ